MFKEKLTKEFLVQEYVCNKKSASCISKEVGCDRKLITNYLKRYGAVIRTPAQESQIQNFCKNSHITKDWVDFLYKERK